MDLERNDVKLADPQPLVCLSGSLIPPFLSKTFDIVDEVSLDSVISWSSNGRSFVVKDPIEFSKTVLPRHFKHNNLSSFVRQLNTYGFRKIDADRLEFANEGFRQGSRHLLKNIQRRKSSQTPKQGGSYLDPSFVETGRSNVEGEVKKLIEEKNMLLQDVVELQQQHVGTVCCMESLNQKILLAEQRLKQTISFLANLFQNSAFSSSVEQIKDQADIGSSRSKRRFDNLQMVKYEPNIPNVPSSLAATDLKQISPEEHIPQKHVIEVGTSVEKTNLEAENAATQEASIAAEFTGQQRFLYNEEEILSPGIESIIEPENLWSHGFNTRPDTSNFDYDSWVDNTHYDEPGLGMTSELSAIWDFDSPQHPGCSGVDKCRSGEFALNERDRQD